MIIAIEHLYSAIYLIRHWGGKKRPRLLSERGGGLWQPVKTIGTLLGVGTTFLGNEASRKEEEVEL